jgi:chromosome segregation ATPase
MWMWTLAVVGTVVLAVWRRPKISVPVRVAVQKASVSLSPDNVLAFSEAYEEKNRVASELKLLEARAQKGKIPRRRYKVQRRTLEVRVDALSKSISELKSVFRSAGGVYADLVRQLDIAEVELVEVETNLRTVEVRYGRGELPLETYKKELADYQKRKEKAETTVNGILLRLREEIH